MKKLKKILELIMGAIISATSVGSITVNAVYSQTTNIAITAPEGYELYELDCEKGSVNYIIRDTGELKGYENFIYNDLSVVVNTEYTVREVYEKYLLEVDFATSNVNTDNVIHLYDKYIKGDDPRSHESVDSKYDKIKPIVAKMYEDGAIKEARFTPMISEYYTASIYPTIRCSYLYGKDKSEFTPLVDELQIFANIYTENAMVNIYEYTPNVYYITLNFSNTDKTSFDELSEICEAIREKYSFDNVSVGYDRPLESIEASTLVSVNLLDPYICDIDGDGNADITDATAILSSYAENAAGIQKAAESDPMDVNGDGTVDLQDATYVLTYYAEAAAGLR